MRKYLLTFLALILISCSAAEPTADEVSVDSSETVTSISSTTSTSTTTTIAVQEPFALDEFGLELVEPPVEMQDQIKELMNFVEKWVGLEFTSDPESKITSTAASSMYNFFSFCSKSIFCIWLIDKFIVSSF